MESEIDEFKVDYSEIKLFVSRLVTSFPHIESIWLIGSRANGLANLDSDWDLLVFGPESLFSEIADAPDLQDPRIDLLS